MESPGAYAKIFKKLGLPSKKEEIVRLQVFVSLLVKWNSSINLIASNEWTLIESLLREAIWASGMYPRAAQTHLDIGSGAGFPAIPMKIMLPAIKLDMVDSRLKRVSFLETAAEVLKMTDIRAHHRRIDEFLDGTDKKWDCISWKALKLRTKEIIRLTEHSHERTQFWIFHGRRLAVEDRLSAEKVMKRVRCERIPNKSDSFLSVYTPG